jgi:hypothetical protein
VVCLKSLEAIPAAKTKCCQPQPMRSTIIVGVGLLVTISPAIPNGALPCRCCWRLGLAPLSSQGPECSLLGSCRDCSTPSVSVSRVRCRLRTRVARCSDNRSRSSSCLCAQDIDIIPDSYDDPYQFSLRGPRNSRRCPTRREIAVKRPHRTTGYYHSPCKSHGEPRLPAYNQ